DHVSPRTGAAHEPAQGEDIWEGRRRRGRGQAGAGLAPGDPRVVEGTNEASDVRPVPPDHDGELVPRDPIGHVDPAKLPRDRRMLLRRVRQTPRLDGGDAAMAVREAHQGGPESLHETTDRRVGHALE